MRIRVAVPEEHVSPTVINAALEAVTRVDHAMIQRGDVPHFNPRLGVRWRPENFGDEHFDHAGIVLQRGWGDCDDLAPWRAASLRASGEDPGAVAIALPSGPDMYHALVRRSDGSNDDPSVAAGMKAKSVVGDGEGLISVWARDPHDGRLYQGSLAPTAAPIAPHCGPTFAVRPLRPDGSKTVVGYQARMDAPVVGSKMVRVKSHLRRHAGRHHHHHHHHHHHVGGWAPYALSSTAGGEDVEAIEALQVACGSALMTGCVAGTLSHHDKYKLFAMHRLLAGHHPSDVAIELARMMDEDHTRGWAEYHRVQGAHGYVVGDLGSFLNDAMNVVTAVSPALAAIPGVGPALAAAVPVVNTIVHDVDKPHHAASMTPAPAMQPQPHALAATEHVYAPHAPHPGAPPPPVPGHHYAHPHPHGHRRRPAPPRPHDASSAPAAAEQSVTPLTWDAIQAAHASGQTGTFVVQF
jgi:hypothetical protein